MWWIGIAIRGRTDWQKTDAIIHARGDAQHDRAMFGLGDGPGRMVVMGKVEDHAYALDFETCERARYSRDPAYDGVFFVAVTSTKIYCRPVCPVRQPLSKNVRYYPSAAAAEDAGFRPCLRCRPESAPHSPAWNGVRATVNRALRLIEAGALDEGDVPTLAERLGVGPRHLARLFHVHLGATPSRVARTARVQRAKRLIDETSLPVIEIAGRAGFSSLRSFNATFLEVYRCPPTALRRRGAAR